MAEAKLLFVNGLGFEGWMERLAQASGSKAAIVTASDGVEPIPSEEEEEHAKGEKHAEEEHHGANDPHAFQSIPNAKIYVGNIRDALIAADPDGKATYEANATAYLAELDKLDADVRAAVNALPEARRKIITSHDAFGYFAKAYGFAFLAPQGVSTDAEASAKRGRETHQADQGREGEGGIRREHHRPAPREAHRSGKRRGDRGRALLGRSVAPRRPGRDLHRHVPPQYKDAERRAFELTLTIRLILSRPRSGRLEGSPHLSSILRDALARALRG